MSTYLPTFPHTARNIGQRWLARTTQCGALHRCLSVRAIHPLREASTRWISPLPSVGIEDCLVLSSPSLFSVVLSVPRERQTHAEGKDVYSGAKTEASGQKRRAEREALRPSHLKRKHRAYLHRHRASEREGEKELAAASRPSTSTRIDILWLYQAGRGNPLFPHAVLTNGSEGGARLRPRRSERAGEGSSFLTFAARLHPPTLPLASSADTPPLPPPPAAAVVVSRLALSVTQGSPPPPR